MAKMCNIVPLCMHIHLCMCVSGLLHPGDMLVEVNGNPVGGLEPEQVIQILVGNLGKNKYIQKTRLCSVKGQR